MAFETKLQPRYDSRKSFYGKARVENEDGKKVLYSYNTKVAEIVDGKPTVFGLYSSTTTRHIKEFLLQNGFEFKDSKDIMNRYGEEQKSESQADGSFNTIGMVAGLGDLYGKTKKEKNEWKLRMIKAGLGNRGFQVPDDWDTLSEDEKEKRLDNVIKVLTEKK